MEEEQNQDMNQVEAPSNLNIGKAVAYMRKGHAVSRPSWNGKGMFVFLVLEGKAVIEGVEYPHQPYALMKTANGSYVPWLASQSDLFADDWQVVADPEH